MCNLRSLTLRSSLFAVAGALVLSFGGLLLFRASAAPPPADQHTAATFMMAHYMPWFEAKPIAKHWGWHWTMNRFDPEKISNGRREIAAHYYPLIGPYDSNDPAVLEYHLLLMKLSGIDGVIVDWYSLENFLDYALI